MAFFIDKSGKPQHVPLDGTVYAAAAAEKLTVDQYLNKKFAADADLDKGTPFRQLCASEGLTLTASNKFGLKAKTLDDVLTAQPVAAGTTNSSDIGAPFGSAARVLYPVAVLDMVEDVLSKDRTTDAVCFDQLVAQELTIAGDNFLQPVVSYSGTNGPESAKAQRATEFATPGSMLKIGTSERYRSLPTFTMGVEYSDKARNSLTVDVIAATVARYLMVERDERVNTYLSALFSGDSDLVIGAVSAVTSNSLDAAATGGVLTHKAWVKFLARYRKHRTLTHVICDIDTYLKIEGRTGRPGSNNYDPTLVRIDPQATPMNAANVGFGNNVQYMIVDAAADGGPVPANTVWALDATRAVTRVRSSTSDYSASESFALSRSTAMRWDWAETVYRQFGDTDLRTFDVLTIS